MIKDIISQNEATKPNDKDMAVLHKYFPQCFNHEGLFDIDKLRACLGGKVDFAEEGYDLNFLGKSYAKLLASLDTETVIKPDLEHNSKPENAKSENVYISGDNLDALKHLLKSYSGKVKCIYIDPPYNTGSDGFVYNDKFNFTAEQLVERLSISDEEAEKILDLTNRNSASHSAWLTFMYPRLVLAKDLLADNGIIFISIDDNEQANLKLLCDNIYGEENFIAQFIWEKRTNRENRAEVSMRHDYILCYTGNSYKEKRVRQLPMNDKALKSYTNPDNDPRGPWKSDPAHVQAGHGTENQFYTLTAPNGKKHELPSGRCWLYTEKVMNEAIKDGRIWFGADGNGVPRVKTYLYAKERGLTPESIIFDKDLETNLYAKDASTNEKAKEYIKNLFDGQAVFETPKPVELVSLLLSLASKDGLVVDFFSGSATTAEAVMKANADHEGNRHYILVQLPEKCRRTSEAYKAGYRTIDEIGMERIRRAANKIRQEHPQYQGDLGFKHFTLQEPSQHQLYAIEDFNPDENLDAFGSPILESFGRETVLTTWLVRDRQGLNAKVKEVKLGDYTAYWCNHYLYLIDAGFSEEAAKALVEEYGHNMDFNPENVIVFGYSLTFSEMERLKYSLQVLRNTEKSLNFNLNVRY